MKKLNQEELEKYYEELKIEWSKELEWKWIKLPKLERWWKYVIDTLVLILFYINFKKVVTKQDLTNFIQYYKPEINDVQQWRHLSQQKWWYIISWQRWDIKCKEMWVKPWEYMFYSLTETYPWYRLNRQTITKAWDFEELKKEYNNRCATCGSKEWEEHLLYEWSLTKLEQWHMNPLKDLTIHNMIPQCDKCNKAYRNFFEFDKLWRVRAVTNAKIILKSDESIQKEVYELLKEKMESN